MNLENYNFKLGCFIINDKRDVIVHEIYHILSEKYNFIVFSKNDIKNKKYNNLFLFSEKILKAALRSDFEVFILQDLEIDNVNLLVNIVDSGHSLILINCSFNENDLKNNILPELHYNLNHLILKQNIKNF